MIEGEQAPAPAPKVTDTLNKMAHQAMCYVRDVCLSLGMIPSKDKMMEDDIEDFIRTLARRAGESAPLPDCDICGKHQTECGALLWSEPQSNGMYFKTHVCVKCYERIKAVTERKGG